MSFMPQHSQFNLCNANSWAHVKLQEHNAYFDLRNYRELQYYNYVPLVQCKIIQRNNQKQ